MAANTRRAAGFRNRERGSGFSRPTTSAAHGGREVPMPTYSSEGRAPRIAPTSHVDPSAALIGKARYTVSKGCYVAPGAVMRGDLLSSQPTASKPTSMSAVPARRPAFTFSSSSSHPQKRDTGAMR